MILAPAFELPVGGVTESSPWGGSPLAGNDVRQDKAKTALNTQTGTELPMRDDMTEPFYVEVIISFRND